MNQVNINQQIKYNINTDKDTRVIEIGSGAIDRGLLKFFPGATLAIFLYLITHLEEGMYVSTNPVIIASYLPDHYDLETIEKGLKYLDKHDIIDISTRTNESTYRIHLNLHKLNDLSGGNPQFEKDVNNFNVNNFNDIELRQKVIRKPSVSRQELVQALSTFIPSREFNNQLRDKIEQLFEDFDLKMIQELVRRVDKWVTNSNNPPEQAFNYLQGIVTDWHKKEINNYEQLKYYDQLHRETRELAYTYGIKDIKPVHMKTFKRWITEDFSLSIPVAKFAIEEAIKRKKDGQPSLTYIEKNFVIPWKKARIKTVEEARAYLVKNQATTTDRGGNNRETNKKRKKKKRWDKFYRNFEDYRET